MMKVMAATRTAVLVLLIFCFSVTLSESALLKATIRDIDGKPVEGVKVFLYGSTNVRKPADFISAASDNNGQTAVNLPDGKYWAVARLKKDALYGPLMPGDKHSGEPVELDCAGTPETVAQFIVADILEIGQKKRTGNTETVKIWGRILDKQGNPLANAYAYAQTSRQSDSIPEFVSAWTVENGNYILYLPSTGNFFIGGSQQFPPTPQNQALKEFVPLTGKLDIATEITPIVY